MAHAPAVAAAVSPPPPAASSPVAPRFDAEYLHNPAPAYAALSRRLGEEGRVLLRVQVNPEGQAEQVEVCESSGFERLDHAARETVRHWRLHVVARRAAQTREGGGMILGLLGLATATFTLWVLWLLADGVRAMVARRILETRKRALQLIVTARSDVTPELFQLTLVRADGKRLPRFRAGQHLTLLTPAGARRYLCARQERMDALAAGLATLGVPASRIHWELFGGAGNADRNAYRITVQGHGEHVFQGEPSLLHALEAWGIPMQADCRAGECGACAVRLLKGEARECLKPAHPAPPGIAWPVAAPRPASW